ncbi:hypothetical protein D1BOALGB6SA_10294 [Olavius sp. associated proteobacterium Delta 1]|nr:hypothetical protein D1BOALGB6SA_10294 [Olavius sp. associated proteobacterium Delta 1]
MWNSADRDGIQQKIANHFCISVPTVYRIRKQLHLSDLHDAKKHPGKKKLFKRIRRLYITKERSTLQIAKIVRMCDENVRKILLKQGVNLGPQHVTNPAYFKTKSSLTPTKLLKEIKSLYVDEKLPASHIAKRLGIDQGTVRNKLRAIGIPIVVRKVMRSQIVVAPNYNIKGIYLGTSEPFSVICIPGRTVTHKGRGLENRAKANCRWCNSEFTQYIDKGPRTQLYCGAGCSNRAKDYRRMLRGTRVSKTRLRSMDEDLVNTWGDEYEDAKKRILSVNPITRKNP